MDIAALVLETDRRLRAAPSAGRPRFEGESTTTAMVVIGLTVPDYRLIRRELSRRIRDETPAEVVALAQALIDTNTLEARQTAYGLLRHHPAARDSLTTRKVEALGRGIDNWNSVDTFSCYVSGPCWREKQITDAAVRRWAASRDRWWRRAAVVSSVPLNQASHGGHGDTDRTLDICARVAVDGDDMVVKGLSWALRTLVSRDAPAVVRFLADHDVHARVRREVGNKLRTGRKNG